MKGVIIHARKSVYEDTSYSNRPKGIPKVPLDWLSFADGVLVLTCIERGDCEGT